MKNSFVKGAVLLTVCALVGKVIGAFYRIPFAMIVGPEGVGLYQLVYPLYALMLTISTSGLPSSISKLLSKSYAQNNHFQAKKYFQYSMIIILLLSSVGFVLILTLSSTISSLQGNQNATFCYVAISPAILFSGVVAGFRGYFQSQENMLPTAISGLIEQVCKVAVGLLLAYMLKSKGIVVATIGAIAGVTASELVAAIYMFISFVVTNRKIPQILTQSKLEKTKRQMIKDILKISIPIALGGLIMPLTMVIDSTLIVRILTKTISSQNATTLFGMQSGVVGSLVNLPIVASIAVQAILLPRITREKTQNKTESVQKTIKNAIFFVLIVAIPCAIVYFVFSNQIISLLYAKSFSAEQITICAKILQIATLNIVALSAAQTSAGILQGLGHVNIPVISLAVGAVIKVAGVVVLVSNPSIGIYGAEISDIICFAVVSLINSVVIHKHIKYNFAKELMQIALVGATIFAVSYFSNSVLLKIVSPTIALVIGGIIVLTIYFMSLSIITKAKTGKSIIFAFKHK